MKTKPEIHLPPPSAWPLVLAIGLLLIADGAIFNPIVAIVGVVVLLTAIGGWAMENRSQGAHHE